MWTTVAIDATVHEQLQQLARAACPREVVAALGGEQHGGVAIVAQLLPLTNLSERDDGFTVAAHEFAQAERHFAAQCRRWLGFAHSHPTGTASPSRQDLQQLWPDCLQLIVAPSTGALGAFVLHRGAARPLEIELTAGAVRR